MSQLSHDSRSHIVISSYGMRRWFDRRWRRSILTVKRVDAIKHCYELGWLQIYIGNSDKYFRKIIIGRHESRWEDNIKMNPKEIDLEFMNFLEDRDW